MDVFDALDAAVRETLRGSVADAAETIATEARNDHPYTDRSRALTESIEALPAVEAPDGRVVGGVAAGAEHASYLEGRAEYAFLQPAADRSAPRIEHDLDTRLRAEIAGIS